MFSTVIPKILCSHRFWLIIAFGLIIFIRIARKKSPPPFPKAVKFFERHKRDIKNPLLVLTTNKGFALVVLVIKTILFKTDFNYALTLEP